MCFGLSVLPTEAGKVWDTKDHAKGKSFASYRCEEEFSTTRLIVSIYLCELCEFTKRQ